MPGRGPQLAVQFDGTNGASPTTLPSDLTDDSPHDRDSWRYEAQVDGSDWNGMVPLWWIASTPCRHCGLTPLDSEPELPDPPPTPARQPPAARRTPQTTVEAIMFAVGERGAAALREPANVARLRDCDDAARREIDARVSLLEARR
jgi:hypothetical protein